MSDDKKNLGKKGGRFSVALDSKDTSRPASGPSREKLGQTLMPVTLEPKQEEKTPDMSEEQTKEKTTVKAETTPAITVKPKIKEHQIEIQANPNPLTTLVPEIVIPEGFVLVPAKSVVKTKSKKFTDSYTRQTVYIINEVLSDLDAISGAERGEKTRLLNNWLLKGRELWKKEQSKK